MLPVCCHPVAILLPFKGLTDNEVADVATFQTISTCKSNIKALNIRPLRIMDPNRKGKMTRFPNRLGEDGRWLVEDRPELSGTRGPVASCNLKQPAPKTLARFPPVPLAGTGRHVSQFQSGDMSPHSKKLRRPVICLPPAAGTPDKTFSPVRRPWLWHTTPLHPIALALTPFPALFENALQSTAGSGWPPPD